MDTTTITIVLPNWAAITISLMIAISCLLSAVRPIYQLRLDKLKSKKS